ncbi:hypothetical protein KI387_018593, partial [Taxus chinensis]
RFGAPLPVKASLRAPRRMRLPVDRSFVASFRCAKGAHFPLSTPLPVRHRRTYLHVDKSFGAPKGACFLMSTAHLVRPFK